MDQIVTTSHALMYCSSAIQFATMRVESNSAPGTLNQLHVGLLHGLTYKLLSLYYQIEAIKSELEVHCTRLVHHGLTVAPQLKVDEQLLKDTETVTSAECPGLRVVSTCLDTFLDVD